MWQVDPALRNIVKDSCTDTACPQLFYGSNRAAALRKMTALHAVAVRELTIQYGLAYRLSRVAVPYLHGIVVVDLTNRLFKPSGTTQMSASLFMHFEHFEGASAIDAMVLNAGLPNMIHRRDAFDVL